MAEGEGSEDRTETATARHLDQAREQGQVPMSRELVAFAGLGAVVFVLAMQSQTLLQRLVPDLAAFLAHAGDGTMLGSGRIQVSVLGLAAAIAPALITALVA